MLEAQRGLRVLQETYKDDAAAVAQLRVLHDDITALVRTAPAYSNQRAYETA